MTDSGPRDRSATERINELLVEGFVTDPLGIAMELIDQDVAAGEYSGDTAIELAATEYQAVAARMIEEGW